MQSLKIHANQVDGVFYRVGDKSKKLGSDERMQLMYDKGDMIYEDSLVRNAGIEDIDIDFAIEYARMISYSKISLQFLEEGQKILRRKMVIIQSVLRIFSFSTIIHRGFFPCVRIRFIKYQGTEKKTGAQMNIIKDVTFEGSILQM